MARFNRTIAVPLVLNAGTALQVTLDAYTANDVVGGLCKFVYGTGGGAVLRAIHIIDDSAQTEPYRIHIYKSSPTVIANDAAFAPAVADGKIELADIVLSSGEMLAANGGAYSAGHLHNLNIDIPETCEGTVYVYLQCTDTPDYAAATDLYIEADFWIE